VIRITWISFGIALALAAPGAARADYTFTTLPQPPGTTGPFVAWAINNAGVVVGYVYSGGGPVNGFSYAGGRFTAIGYPGAFATQPQGINDAGQIVGGYGILHGTGTHGFILDRGSFTAFNVLGAVETNPYGINNLGQIVGESDGTGFFFDGSRFNIIEGSGAVATVINDQGRLSGSSPAPMG
jgi:uncharacterized membrane protein